MQGCSVLILEAPSEITHLTFDPQIKNIKPRGKVNCEVIQMVLS
jgi:hypothetical protein